MKKNYEILHWWDLQLLIDDSSGDIAFFLLSHLIRIVMYYLVTYLICWSLVFHQSLQDVPPGLALCFSSAIRAWVLTFNGVQGIPAASVCYLQCRLGVNLYEDVLSWRAGRIITRNYPQVTKICQMNFIQFLWSWSKIYA